MHNAMHAKRRPVKKYIHVKPIYNRDAKGRFTGGLKRKGYTRKILDMTRWTTGLEMMAANIESNNALLKRLAGRE